MIRSVAGLQFTFRYPQFVQLRFGGCFLICDRLVGNAFRVQIFDLFLNGSPLRFFFRNFRPQVLIPEVEFLGLT